MEIVQLLIQDPRPATLGIDINISDYDKISPFHEACYNGHLEIVRLLIEDQRIKFNPLNKYGETPFHEACRKKHFKIIKFLIKEHRLDVNTISKYMKSHFYEVCSHGNIDIINLFF